MSVRTMAVALILITAACSGSTKSQSAKTGGEKESASSTKSLIDEDEEKEDKEILAGRQCLGENHKPKECLSDEDCCQGFYCGKDPEGSPRLKVCIDNGG